MPIPEPLEAPEGSIPKTVASLSGIDAPEAAKPLISFRRYNESECEVEAGEIKPYAPAALRAIKEMGTQGVFANAKTIVNAGDYACLYKGLSDIPELSIQEVPLKGKNPTGGKSDRGRIFFFRTDNTVSLVAIRANHYDTDKGRH